MLRKKFHKHETRMDRNLKCASAGSRKVRKLKQSYLAELKCEGWRLR
jgi:hypothetical protein